MHLPPLLEVRGLRKAFGGGGFFRPSTPVVAVESVSFKIDRGEAVAVVGESGSGKSTLAKILLRLETPDAGEIHLDGNEVLSREPRRASQAYRGRVQMVFQDPFGSLNPVHSVAHHIARPLQRLAGVSRREVRGRVLELLRTVDLEPAEEFAARHPYELSGGQRQRVAIARALAVEPDLLVADEPTSMLDVSIRIGILNLLAQLKRERQLAILLITHDLASARYLADRILVLYRGRVVEEGPSHDLVTLPLHPYTRALLASIAGAGGDDPGKAQPGTRNAGVETAGGCPFTPRCPDVLDVCGTNDPAPRSAYGRRVRCHLYTDNTEVQEGTR